MKSSRVDYVIRLYQTFSMKSVSISEFKAKCIAILHEVNQSGEPVTVTKRGKPIAKIEPFEATGKTRVVKNHGSMTILGEIVQADFDSDWEMNA